MNPLDALNRLIDLIDARLAAANASGLFTDADRLRLAGEAMQAREAKVSFEKLIAASNAHLNAPHGGHAANSKITVAKARHELHLALQPFKEPLE